MYFVAVEWIKETKSYIVVLDAHTNHHVISPISIILILSLTHTQIHIERSKTQYKTDEQSNTKYRTKWNKTFLSMTLTKIYWIIWSSTQNIYIYAERRRKAETFERRRIFFGVLFLWKYLSLSLSLIQLFVIIIMLTMKMMIGVVGAFCCYFSLFLMLKINTLSIYETMQRYLVFFFYIFFCCFVCRVSCHSYIWKTIAVVSFLCRIIDVTENENDNESKG